MGKMGIARARRAFGTVLGSLALAAGSLAATGAQPAHASSAIVVGCGALYGSGSYSDPLRLGTVRGTLIVTGCAPLTSGTPYNRRYFIFAMGTPGANAVAGARFRLTGSQNAAVHPRLASGAWTVRTSSSHGFWTGDSPNFTGRWLPLRGLSSGTYRLGVEKLRSPLSSYSTPRFDIVISMG
ncbi:hypothetical protein Ssi03_30730 [Sphaerisporangium siamense]|nr:hypothetical protein Ssi03_30730 [Sphaerisporangium siamense]